MIGRRRITKDMLEAAERKGWNSAQTARHYETHSAVIDDACERFGVVLPEHGAAPTPPKKKPSAAWSAGPEAIKRALEKMQPASGGMKR